MKVRVDEEKCIGCGLCVSIAPEVFEISNEGKSHAKLQTIPKELEEKVKEAAEACPVSAIIID